MLLPDTNEMTSEVKHAKPLPEHCSEIKKMTSDATLLLEVTEVTSGVSNVTAGILTSPLPCPCSKPPLILPMCLPNSKEGS